MKHTILRTIFLIACYFTVTATHGKNKTVILNPEPDKPVQCLLKGEVINRPQSSRLVVLKASEDYRRVEATYIPIHDGKFEHLLCADAEELYQLIFYEEIRAGNYRAVDFIAEPGTCYFTLHSSASNEEWKRNSVRGGKYTGAYYSIIDSLRRESAPLYAALDEKSEQLSDEDLYTPEANSLREQINRLSEDDPQVGILLDRFYNLEKEGKKWSQAKKDIEEEFSRIRAEYLCKLLEYAKKHPDITGYTFLMENFQEAIDSKYYTSDIAPMLSVFYGLYEKKYPHHPYTSTIYNYIQASVIQAGNPCPDVVATDCNGKDISLSELIKGKIALLHLWTSWCGPCRRHGIEMIPVYETYRDRGFTVVGIAREQNKEAMIKATKKDKYPWTNLLELNDKNSIWAKFGIGNAGGAEFLVDAQGNFIAVDPSIEKIKEILKELLD
jgi:thiol-disulfide isomerase/thioredoxin